jgi:p-cumate 2,3-dioxygenase subunit alpha
VEEVDRRLNGIVKDDPDAVFARLNQHIFSGPMGRADDRISEKSWLYMGHESEIPNFGDFVVRKLAGRPLLMIRGSDGKVRVLINACMHRGGLVCMQRKGNAETFRCNYHAWLYDNQGRLAAVPREEVYGPGFNRAELGLRSPTKTAISGGFVFITFNTQAEGFADYLATVNKSLEASSSGT